MLKAIALCLACLLLCSCRSRQELLSGESGWASAKGTKQIVFGAIWEPVGFYPTRAIDSGSYLAQTLVYDGLLKYDKNLDIVPALAESWSVSPDGLTYTFTLRKHLRFSDDAPLGLEDVRESFKLATAGGSPFKSDYKDIARFAVENDKFVICLSNVNAALPSRLVELRILPARLLTSGDQGRSYLSRNPVGSGPFKLAHWQSGLELVFERNANYWGKPPSIDKLIWRIVPDKTLLALAVDRGEIDVAQIDAQSWKELLSRNDKLALERFSGSRTIYLGMNCAKEPFDQLKFRVAAASAIDKQILAQKLFYGYARVSASDAPGASWYFNANAKSPPYDPALSKLILAGDKKMQGKPLSGFRIETLRDHQDVAEVVSIDLTQDGMKNEVETVEYTTLKRKYLQSGAFTAFVWSRSAGPDPECGIVWGPSGTLNYVRFKDHEINELLEEGRRTSSRPERARVYGRIQRLLAAKLPWDFLVQPDLLIVHSARCRNIKEAGQATISLPWDNPLFNAPDWYIER
jgi:peptide/nickel transport system substrate-binding protein